MATNGTVAPFSLTLRQLPLPARLVLSLFLLAVGLGYGSALMQLHFRNASRGEPLPTPDDIVEIFSGVENWPVPKPAPPKPVSKLERLVMAPLDLPHNGTGTMAFAFFKKAKTEEEREQRKGEQLAVRAWIDAPDDQRKEAYESDAFALPDSLAHQPITPAFVKDDKVEVKKIIDKRCASCHDSDSAEGQKRLVDYTDFTDVLVVPTVGHTSRQMSLESLVQTTHLHLLSFCVLWMLTGLIFAFSGYPKWFRCLLAPIVLLAQVADVSCWWLARQTDPCLFLYQYLLPHGVGPYFALAIIGTGTVVGVGLGLQILLSLWDMYRLPGRVVLFLLLVGGATAGVLFFAPRALDHLNQEKAPPPSATAPDQ